jgi:hypothetical protein
MKLTIEQINLLLTGLDAIVRRDGLRAANQSATLADELAVYAATLPTEEKAPEPRKAAKTGRK